MVVLVAVAAVVVVVAGEGCGGSDQGSGTVG